MRKENKKMLSLLLSFLTDLYTAVDNETKQFNFTLIFPCKSSWDFSKKNLVDSNLKTIKPLIAKGRLWLKFFSYSNLLCARATRAITNHALIEEY